MILCFLTRQNFELFSRTHYSDFTWKCNVGSKFNLDRNCTGNGLGVLSRAMEACKTFVYGHWWLNNSRFSVKIHLWKNIEENGKMGDQKFLVDFGESIFPGPPVKIRGQSGLSSLRYLRRCLWIAPKTTTNTSRDAQTSTLFCLFRDCVFSLDSTPEVCGGPMGDYYCLGGPPGAEIGVLREAVDLPSSRFCGTRSSSVEFFIQRSRKMTICVQKFPKKVSAFCYNLVSTQ